MEQRMEDALPPNTSVTAVGGWLGAVNLSRPKILAMSILILAMGRWDINSLLCRTTGSSAVPLKYCPRRRPLCGRPVSGGGPFPNR
jgi:hypothetical protein